MHKANPSKKIKWQIGTIFFIFCLFISVCELSYAQSHTIEKAAEGESKEPNMMAAKREIIEKTTQKVSEELIKEIIGEAKFAKNRTLIYSKITKNSARFIPFSKTGDILGSPEVGYRMTTTFKINVDDLQAMLLNQGLFYESEGSPILLPFVRVQDKINGKKYAWWSDSVSADNFFIVKLSRLLEIALKNSFEKNYFYVYRPGRFHWSDLITADLKSFQLKSEDLQVLGQTYGAQMIIDGEVSIQKGKENRDRYQLGIKLSVNQVVNYRLVAEVSRNFETQMPGFDAAIEKIAKEAFEAAGADLSMQVMEAWQKGALGASIYKLTVNGPLGLLQQEQLKEFIRSKLREVKSIRERVVSSGNVVYEVDTTLNPQDLSRKLPEMDLQGVKIVLDSVKDTETIYRVEKK